MSGLSAHIAAHRSRASREFLDAKPKFIRDFANWALDNGCTHAITLTPDIRPHGRFDPETELKPIMRRVAKAIAHDVRGVPHRRLLTNAAIAETVWMAGFVELHSRSGSLYPHFHGAIALRPGEDRRMKAVLASRWGKGPDAPAIHPVFNRPGSWPDFDVCKLTHPRSWIGYSLKHTSLSDVTLWTHNELLHRTH